MPTLSTPQQLTSYVKSSDSLLTVFGTRDGQLQVMYSDLIQCYRLIKCGRVPLLHQVNKKTPAAEIRKAISLWQTGGPDPDAQKRALKAKSGG